MKSEITLRGPEGENSLGFLSALGAFRLASDIHPEASLRWEFDQAWRPVLNVPGIADLSALMDELLPRLKQDDPIFEIVVPGELPKWTGKPKQDEEAMKRFITRPDLVSRAELAAFLRANPRNTYAAAFWSDVCPHHKEPDKAAVSRFVVPNGGSKQYFFPRVRMLRYKLTPEWLSEALDVSVWPRSPGEDIDPLTLAFDTAEVNNTATPEPPRKVPAAQLLAVEALPLYPVMPGLRRELITTGWTKNVWTWPLWEEPLERAAVEALLADPLLQAAELDMNVLRRRGIVAAGRAKRGSNPANKHQVRLIAVPV